VPALQSYTDLELIELMRTDDEAAFAEIYRRYSLMLISYSLKVIQEKEQAKDIVQEVFISIWKRRVNLNLSGDLSHYLLKAVRNLSIRYIEKNITEKNFTKRFALFTQHLPFSPYSALEIQELEEKIEAAINNLPPKMKEVYYLSRYENLSYKEIANKLGIAETTVKKQVSNALHIIRNEIKGIPGAAIIYALFFLD